MHFGSIWGVLWISLYAGSEGFFLYVPGGRCVVEKYELAIASAHTAHRFRVLAQMYVDLD